MPLISLKIPFINHYAGCVFELNDAIVLDDDEENLINREKQDCFSKNYYLLPDDGRGRQVNLLVENTLDCPKNIFNNDHIKQGPCRITSVTINDELFFLYGDDSLSLPQHDFKIDLVPSDLFLKNRINFLQPFFGKKLIIQNRVSLKNESSISLCNKDHSLNFDNCNPGFYLIEYKDANLTSIKITMIKLFPFTLMKQVFGAPYKIEKTIW